VKIRLVLSFTVSRRRRLPRDTGAGAGRVGLLIGGMGVLVGVATLVVEILK